MTDWRTRDRNTVNGLHPAQADTLAAIRRFVAEHNASPTLAELAEACGCSPRVVSHRLGVLDAQGWIRRPGSRYGRIRLTDKPWPDPAGGERGQLLGAVLVERFGPDARRVG